ncbi:hypothetical protein [Frankia sp. CiP3]|uniref:hypothetical protein n=1 Tax=Frankia sp. CiP3 TaxID=2880971 RepID=UPI001EF4F84E|nr:hypothetical protein [Frankia sp. CiP3]
MFQERAKMLPGRPDLFVINIPRPVLVGLGSAVLLLVVLALVGSLDSLALAAVLSYLILYGFSLVLLRSPHQAGSGRADASGRARRGVVRACVRSGFRSVSRGQALPGKAEGRSDTG